MRLGSAQEARAVCRWSARQGQELDGGLRLFKLAKGIYVHVVQQPSRRTPV